MRRFEHHYLVEPVDGDQIVPLRILQLMDQLAQTSRIRLLQRKHGHHPGLGQVQPEKTGRLLQLIDSPLAPNEL